MAARVLSSDDGLRCIDIDKELSRQRGTLQAKGSKLPGLVGQSLGAKTQPHEDRYADVGEAGQDPRVGNEQCVRAMFFDFRAADSRRPSSLELSTGVLAARLERQIVFEDAG